MRTCTLGVTLFALFCGMVISSTEVHAQPNGTSSAKASAVKPVEQAWHVQMGFVTGSTLYKQDAYERQTIEAFGISPSYSFSESWALEGNVAVIRDDSIGGVGNTFFDNTIAVLNYTRKLNSYVKWKTSFGGVAPTNQDMRDKTTYQGAAKLGTGFLFEGLPLGSTIATSLIGTRNFHQYTEDSDGGFNIRDDLGVSLGGELPIIKTFSFATGFKYTAGRNYLDTVFTKFSFESGFNWTPIKELTIALATSNEGNAVKPNGRDSNIEFFNNDTSTIQFGLAYTF